MSRTRRIIAAVITAAALAGGLGGTAIAATAGTPAAVAPATHLWG